MDNPDMSKRGDVVAWVILGHLYTHPGSKDTVAGIWKWWLHAEGVDAPLERVRLAVEHLVEAGWVTSSAGYSGILIYGLNPSRRVALQRLFLRKAAMD